MHPDFQIYSDAFKAQMVRRLIGPPRVSTHVLANETGVSQASLSRWLREAKRMSDKHDHGSSPVGPRRPQDWSPQEKWQAVLKASSLAPESLGAFLREQGLTQTQLDAWREAALQGLVPTRPQQPEHLSAAERKRVKQLEKELRRKDKALAELSALLVLSKKAQALWGDEDDSTSDKNEK